MTEQAIVGLGFGDEGKGLVTNSLCHRYPEATVIRYSGGQQAGHTVHTKDNESHVFSNFGSGSFVGCPTYWSKYCTVDPIGIIREDMVLQNKDVTPVLYLDRKCPVTTPYDKNIYNIKHGTCGVGVGSTWQREQDNYSLLVGDLEFPEIVKIKLQLIAEHYGFSWDKEFDTFLYQVQVLLEMPNIHIVKGPFPAPHFIFEGSQGLLLDQDIGFFPHVTRSSTGSKNIKEMTKGYPRGPRPNDGVYYNLVTRAYQTRHGPGPMTNRELPLKLKNNENETNKAHEYQGEFRTSVLNVSTLAYAMMRDDEIWGTKRKRLIITCCDQIIGEYQYTYGTQLYKCNTLKKFKESISILLKINEVITTSSADEIINWE